MVSEEIAKRFRQIDAKWSKARLPEFEYPLDYQEPKRTSEREKPEEQEFDIPF